jgi:hypothetical protein
MDFGGPQGYEDLNSNNRAAEEESPSFYEGGPSKAPASKKTRPAFYSRSVKAAERAAIRTQVNEADSFLLLEDGEGVPPAPSRTPGTFGRRSRIQGDCPAAYKKVTAELNSDDDLMMTMREKGFTDAQISQRLSKEGRARYDRKTISTRIGRIKAAQATHSDYLLEEGFKEWTHEDDICLMQAYEFANIEVNYEIERTRAWRFRKVAEYMRRLDKDMIFSENACRERYQAIMRGTARIPTDLDDDPDARRAEMEAYREERERKRAIENAAKEEEAARDRAIKEETRLCNAQRAKQTALAREKKQQEKAQRAMRRAAQNQVKLQRAQENKTLKIQRLEKIRAQKATEKEEAVKRNRDQNDNTPLAIRRVADLKFVTADTPDPRSFLSFEDLQHLCKERSLRDDGRSEELVQRLRDADDERYRTGAELKRICRSRGLNIAGTNVMLKYQLALAEAKGYASFHSVSVSGGDGVTIE